MPLHTILPGLDAAVPATLLPVLEAQPGSDAVQAGTLAMQLFRARLRDSWRIDSLARALGVSGRTLHRITRRDYGLPPMQLLRKLRLLEVRERLLAARTGTTVTVVALDCGFTHLSRFSHEYEREFGELPSATLRRVREARPAEDAPSPAGHA